MHDDYKQLELPAGVEPCPCCGSAPTLWQYSESATDPTKKLIMCSNGEDVGPRISLAYGGCLLYMPPNDFYRETIRDATRYWNEHAVALRTIRELNDGRQTTA